MVVIIHYSKQQGTGRPMKISDEISFYGGGEGEERARGTVQENEVDLKESFNKYTHIKSGHAMMHILRGFRVHCLSKRGRV